MNTPVDITKMNGTGNKILIIDMRGRTSPMRSRAILNLAHKEKNEFDQMMAIYVSKNKAIDYLIEIFNNDGSSAQACGNGTRCVVEWLYQKEKKDHFCLKTKGGLIQAQRLQNGLVSVDMGKPTWNWEDIPLSYAVSDTNHVRFKSIPFGEASLVSIGNPHAIFFVENNPASYNIEDWGPEVEQNPLFPEGINVSIALVTSRTSLNIRTWERGVGLTQSCGSAACASIVAACRRNLTERKVTVAFPGGDLYILWKKNNNIIMTGNTQYEYSALLDPITGYLIKEKD
ncbi:MAG: diaminopimelate epimerase [Candidatus Tokpelaia sp. JSC161]|nr:MAG: diaminopimelate epimerase [Candidatus Tokpelaia sp. JSC161]